MISKSHSLDEPIDPMILIGGHVVIDEIIDSIDQLKPRRALGGPSSYSSVVLTSLGYTNYAVTKVGNDFPEDYSCFLRNYGGIDIDSMKVLSARTTSYRIDRTLSPRRLWLINRCKPLSFQDFSEHLRSKQETEDITLLLNPVAGEISLSLLDRISKEFESVLVDSQGFVRRIDPRSSEVSMRNGIDISALSGVDILKSDREELQAWTGLPEIESSIKVLSKFVDVILLTAGPGEVDLYEKSKLIMRARPPLVEIQDTTGAGDIMLATFAAKYSETHNLREALWFSVCAATLSVRTKGIEKALLKKSAVISSMQNVKITEN